MTERHADETPELRLVRKKIDALDRRIVGLLNERAELGREVGRAKLAEGRRAIADAEREREVLLRVTMANAGPLPQADLLAMYRRLIAATKALEAQDRRRGGARRRLRLLRVQLAFAPAETGYLHLGHVANALYVWGLARSTGRRVVLRIEDHDRQRSRPEFEAALLEDLGWLGFMADTGPVRQSDDWTVYEAELARLRDGGLVYACDCTRSTFAAWARTHGRPWSASCTMLGSSSDAKSGTL